MHQVFSATRRLAAHLQIFSLILLLMVAGAARAQLAGTGSIQGSVADATGAVIPNAAVTLTNRDTQVKHIAKTDSSGLYAFSNIDIGTYSVSVSLAGFETYTKSGIVLEVGSSISVNVAMTVGAQDQKIEVRSEGLALQTEDVSFKQTIDEHAVTEMPLNGRHMTDLITLSGGSAPAPAGDFTGSKYSYAAISISIAGGNGNTTSWKLDGGDNNDWMANANLPFPFPDAVNQFSVESTALGAQDGVHSGGLVNVVTRSGTNTFHGSGFEFIRNNFIDAVNFFTTCTPVAPATTCTAKDTLHQNQYGFTFGGPVWLPKIFNGKDKLFFFTGFQFEKSDQAAATTSAYLPTAANLAGDWSVTDPAPGTTPGGKGNTCSSEEQLYDPVTGAVLVGNKYPAGVTPAYNAAAKALLPYLPKVAPLPDGSDVCGHVAYAIPSIFWDKQFVTRIDYTINAKNHLYGRYLLDGYQSPAPFSPQNILFTTASGNIERVQNATVGEDFAINSTTVNSVHATVSRRVNNRGYNSADINLATLGVNVYQFVPNGLQLTSTTSGKSHGFTIGGGTNSVSHFNDNAFSFDDDVTMVRGRHQIAFGGEYVRNELNISNAYETNGTGGITGIYSSNGPTGTGACLSGTSAVACAAGDANLDFLWGAENSFQQSKQQQNALRAPIPSLYVQDTFHATKQLTIVAGVRWSPEYYPSDYFGRGTVFNYNAFVNNQFSTVFPNAPAGAFFFGDKGIIKSYTESSPLQFAPNVGFSYDLFGNGKTVIRMGAEVAYDEVNFFSAQRNEQNPPFATASNPNTAAQLCFSQPWLVGGTGFGCAQVGGNATSPYPTPQIPTPATAIFPAQGQFIVMPGRYHPSDTVQWTASVQQDLGHGWQLQLDYIGNKTNHAPIGYPLSDAVYIPGVWGAGGAGCDPIVKTGPAAVKPGAAGTACSTTANQNSRFALTIANNAQGNQYLGGGGGSILVGDFGIANYNGLVTTVQHRLSSTFSLLFNHTWSKCLNISDASGDLAATSISQPKNIRADYGPCGSDYRDIENVVLVVKSGFAFSNRIEKAILNNWEFAPLVHIQSGGPFTVTQGSDISLTDNSNLDRPNLVPGVPIYIHQFIGHSTGEANRGYLNQSAFVNNIVPGSFGNIGRNSFRGIPSYQVDSQVSRIFPIHESIALDLRLEAFNMLNHPNFSNPSASNPGAPGTPNTSFGQIGGSSAARIFQGAIKLSF